MSKTTPFYPRHLAAGGKMVEFAGYQLPIQFRGIIPEHHRVRTTVGVFDVSHMGRIKVWGRDALQFINQMTTNDASNLAVNQAQYSVMCYPDGGIVDDLVIYRLPDHYLLVVNGANNEKDTAWLREHLTGDVRLENVTTEVAQLAIQGPKSEACLQKISSIDLSPIGFYWAAEGTVAGVNVLISRTGYTGEDGFELYIPAEQALKVWDAVMAAGKEFEIEPIGLGARDTLRLEMKYCLYGNDIDQTTNPLEAGLGFVVKLDKPGGFIGVDVLQQVAREKPRRRLVCLETENRAIPRPKLTVYSNGDSVGFVTSGTLSPSLNKGIALAYVQREFASVGNKLTIELRGTRHQVVVVAPPFYKHGSRKK
ncbi:MAG: glycine cleavage system aminomethyltransferase GcvT [candidate division WOR-3 bacterium]|nr:glycine cleavage system aminomethyltransferase GcvT [candidate division WOR-3 bacterium]